MIILHLGKKCPLPKKSMLTISCREIINTSFSDTFFNEVVCYEYDKILHPNYTITLDYINKVLCKNGILKLKHSKIEYSNSIHDKDHLNNYIINLIFRGFSIIEITKEKEIIARKLNLNT